MYTIGITGGIASGKSTVVQMLQGYGAAIIDCDVLARDVVAPGSKGLQSVREAFGPQAVRPDGSMDRAYIGSVVFHQPARKAELEGILFPLIQQGIEDAVDSYSTDEKKSVVFLDMPLLFEVKYDAYVNETWLVYVDPSTQLKRLMIRNGFTEQEALVRIQAQLPIDTKRSLAQVIIDNTGSLETTKEQVRTQWDGLLSRIQHL
ncbi:MAG: dephospho-CoA kinase [Megasphaera sp.]|jgi:dephospho-CoA kinase|nr:dephospho-CoA kinase [Megasphaera sp.]MCI1247786.1 dephospho-CoA kinase [Megasphaera sp.]